MRTKLGMEHAGDNSNGDPPGIATDCAVNGDEIDASMKQCDLTSRDNDDAQEVGLANGDIPIMDDGATTPSDISRSPDNDQPKTSCNNRCPMPNNANHTPNNYDVTILHNCSKTPDVLHTHDVELALLDNINTNCDDVATDSADVPDGGWGWVIVLASFIIHVIADGIVYSFGIFFVEFLDEFHGTRSETAWLGSLLPGITLTSGPIASALTNRYGCRVVTIAGSLIASAGFVLSTFGHTLGYLYFSFGIMSGIGFGLIYLPAIVSVTQYFEKRRAFATGLAVCGSGIGTFVFAPFSNWLIQTYMWRGAILILAGVVLNCVISGTMFRKLPVAVTNDEICDLDDEKRDVDDECDAESNNISHFANVKVWNGIRSNHLSKSVDIIGRIRRNTDTSDGEQSKPLAYSTLIVPDHGRHYARHRHHNSHQSLNPGVLYRRDIFYSGSLYNIAQYRSNPALYHASIQSIHIDEHDAPKHTGRCWNFSPQISSMLSEMLDTTLFKNPIFVMFAISNFFTSIGFNMPFIYLPDRAIHIGISANNAAFLVSIIGIANTVGRIVFGWLADRSWVNRLMLYSTSLVVCGLATALSPLATGFGTLALYACVFGIFIGVYVSLTSVVLVDLLGIEKLTNSFGLLLLFQGLATFIGPPIAGWLHDITGSFDYSFIVEGLLIAFSGLMLYAIPIMQRRCACRSGDIIHVDVDVHP